MKITTDEEADLAYFRTKLESGLELTNAKNKKQLELIEDSIAIYHEHRPPNAEVTDLMKFGFSAEEAESLLDRHKYTHSIPNSFLVQTFMRKLQDGLDRRRP